jgi:hypothetical protein
VGYLRAVNSISETNRNINLHRLINRPDSAILNDKERYNLMKYSSLQVMLILSLIGTILTMKQTVKAESNSGTSRTTVRITTNGKTTETTKEGDGNVHIQINNTITNNKEVHERHEIEITESTTKLEHKISELKDEGKQKIAKNLTSQINRANNLRTGRYLSLLDRLASIVDKIETRSKTAEAQGKDISNITSEIAAIRVKLHDAVDKVTTQQNKTYTVNTSSDKPLATDFRTLHKQMKSDLTGLQDEIKGIRQDVVTLYKDLQTAVL